MDLKFKEARIRECYEAIWSLKNALGDDLTAEVIVRAFQNSPVLTNAILFETEDVDFEPLKK